MFAQVIVDIVHENVARTFTYRIPAALPVQVGQRVAVPFGRLMKEGVVVSLTEECGLPPDKLRDIRETLEDYPAILPDLITLAEQMAGEAHCPLAETLRLMLPAEMRGGRIAVKTEPCVQLTIPIGEVDEAIQAQGRSMKRKKLLDILRDGEKHGMAELRLLVKEPNQAIRELQEDGLVQLLREEVLRRPGGDEAVIPIADPALTPWQQEALDEILPEMRRGRGKFLLHGVTGSGKTEVFIRLVREALKMGKSAIILVPEIALTPQMVSWFRSRFGDGAAVLHSRLSAGERFDEWRRIRRGDARVVIGARSAIFAPCENLGLIVVDEEHETTYLSDHHPRYDARDVAALRCDNEGAALLLASATPSILSFARARRGDYTLLEMPRRVGNRPMPQVHIVDMRQEMESGNRSVFSGLLQQKLRACLQKGEQAMLLMNRRGYNTFVSCRSCGLVMKCPNCDVSLTYHQVNSGRLHCHYCGHMQDVPERCPECASRYIRYFGAGTQKVEDELHMLFPHLGAEGIARMDIDTTSGKEGHARILEQFRSGRARILVGTQMIAKGLDFPKVTLVGVVAADMTLNLPDYRSRERTFQLLTQVAGRAGRGMIPGEVVVQTYKPEDEIIQLAAKQDYRAFFELEFSRRRTGLYPPFTIMARLLVESPSEADARKTAEMLNERCASLLSAHPMWKKRVLMQLLDQPGVKVLRGKARWHVLFKLLDTPAAAPFVQELTDMSREEYPGTDVYFEYNPTTMM